MANIELPKDAEGREIPLDTKVLYNEEGNPQDVARFTYSLRNMPLNKRWAVVFINTSCKYASDMFLNPPEPPDSWEKLEEDLDRCIRADCLCPYNQSEECHECIMPMESQNHCNSIALKEIKERIRKLRGDDE